MHTGYAIMNEGENSRYIKEYRKVFQYILNFKEEN